MDIYYAKYNEHKYETNDLDTRTIRMQLILLSVMVVHVYDG